MHVYEGILTGTTQGQIVLVAGTALSAVGTGIGLCKLEHEKIPQAAVLTAAFFVASSIQIPLGPTVEHLVLCGLMGLVLGWAAFPAVLVALGIQSVFLTSIGLTPLGVNTLIMALPAVVCYYAFRRLVCSSQEKIVFLSGAAAGFCGVVIGSWLDAGALILAGKSYQLLGLMVPLFHLPLAIAEGLVTGSVVVLLRKVRPEILGAPRLVAVGREAEHG